MKNIAYHQNITKNFFFLSTLAQNSPEMPQLLIIVSCAMTDLIIIFIKETKKNLKTLFHCKVFVLQQGMSKEPRSVVEKLDATSLKK